MMKIGSVDDGVPRAIEDNSYLIRVQDFECDHLASESNPDMLLLLPFDYDGKLQWDFAASDEYPVFQFECPKRQKTSPHDQNPDDYFCYPTPIPWELNFSNPAPAAPVPKFQPPEGSDEVKKKQSLSEQSMTARQRRISEKTKELEKLIPGGNKMNTAEMFQTAADQVPAVPDQHYSTHGGYYS